MMRDWFRAAVQWLKRVVTQPRDELDRWQRAARFAYDLGRYGGRQLTRDRAPQMAAALAFRTLFALFPVLVVAPILLKAVRGTDAFLELTGDLLASTSLADIHVVPPTDVSGEAGAVSMSLAEWLQDLVSRAASVNLAGVGWIGLGLIIYAAVGLMVTIEDSFNTVFRAPEGRSWVRRVPLYWFILTVGPVAIGAMWYANSWFEQWIETVATWPALLRMTSVAWRLLVVWLFMFAVYALIPNTTVSLRPVMMGALVTSALVEVGRRTMDVYLQNAFAISQLYGSLGLIPLFMFWVYIMWLVVLFGLEVGATLQMLHGRKLEELQSTAPSKGISDPASVVTAMEVVAQRFAVGQSTTMRHIAEEAHLPEATVSELIRSLIDAGIVHRVEGQDGAVSLARPPEQIRAEELIEIGFALADAGGAGYQSKLISKLRQAQKTLAARFTLASLVTSE